MENKQDEINKHIEDAIKYFINQKSNPQYGIMINGEWGSGKTYFIKEYFKKEEKEKEIKEETREKIIYLSMYGIETIKEIDELLFNEIIYKNKKFFKKNFIERAKKSKIGKILTKTGSEIVNNKFGADIEKIYKEVTELTKPFILKEGMEKVKVIVVDDLERGKANAKDILAYFSKYIEDNIRVIFISNEKEIKDYGDYLKTKEKVIGQTFKIDPTIEDAIKMFLKKGINLPIKDEKVISVCKEVLTNLNTYNLRIIWQGLIQVKRLLDTVEESQYYKSINYKDEDYEKGDLKKEDYLAKILMWYFVIYIQIKNGSMEKFKLYREEKEKNNEEEKGKTLYNYIMFAMDVYEKEKKGIEEGFEIREKRYNDDNNDTWSSILFNNMLDDKILFLRSTAEKIEENQLTNIIHPSVTRIWENFINDFKIDRDEVNVAVEGNKNMFVPIKKLTTNLEKLEATYLNSRPMEFKLYHDDMIKELEEGKYTQAEEILRAYKICAELEEYKGFEYDNLLLLFEGFLENENILEWNIVFRWKETENCEKIKGIIRKKEEEKLHQGMIERIKKEFLAIKDCDNKAMYEWNINNLYTPYSKEGMIKEIGIEKIFNKIITMDCAGQCNILKTIASSGDANKELNKKIIPDLKEFKNLYEEKIKKTDPVEIPTSVNVALEYLKEFIVKLENESKET